MSARAIPASPPRATSSLQSLASHIGLSIAVGLGSVVLTIVVGMLITLLGMPVPAIESPIDIQASLVYRLIGGTLLGLVLGPLARRLEVSAVERISALLAVVFAVNSLVNLIEGVFFTSFFDVGLASTVLSMVLSSVGLAALLGLLFPPMRVSRSLRESLGSLFAARGALNWVGRIGLASVLYVPTYFFFGNLVYPFVRSYYEDPSLGMGLRVPGFEVLIPLEIVRGLIYVLALLPVVALLDGSRWRLAFWLGLSIAALNGWEPLLTNVLWPPELRLAHGLEITGDAIVQGLTLAFLIGVSRVTRRSRKGLTSE